MSKHRVAKNRATRISTHVHKMEFLCDDCRCCGKSTPADSIELSEPSYKFHCQGHFSPACIPKGASLYTAAVQLAQNGSYREQFYVETSRLPTQLLGELMHALQIHDENQAKLLVLANPTRIAGLKNSDRVFRLVRRAGIAYPNQFCSEGESWKLLVKMLKKRSSVTLIRSTFKEWPRPKDVFEMVRMMAVNRYAPFEKTLVIETLAPFYVRAALRENTLRCVQSVKLIPDALVRHELLTFITTIERLFILKAMAKTRLTASLPTNLRRYLVESFFNWAET